MKNKLLAVMAIFGMVASASAVKINNNLSINGFIDGSYNMQDADAIAGDNQSLSVDEVEVDFIVNVGNVAGEIHLNSGPNFDGGDVAVEQAHISYSINDQVSVTFGKYSRALGFEREDPAGLYTFSRAYSDSVTARANDFNFGDVDNNAVEGLKVSYAAESFTFAASLQSAHGQSRQVEAAGVSNDLNLELSIVYTGIAGVNIGGGFLFDNQDNSVNENDLINFHVSRQFGKLLLAGEYSEIQNTARDRDAYLLLADYDINNKLGVAVRFSNNEQSTANQGDYEKFTIAPNYAITESLGAIIEYSDVENNNAKSEEYAVELTYTF